MRSCVAGYKANPQCIAYASLHGRQAVPTRPFRRTSCSGKPIACTSQKPDDSFAFKPRKRADWQDGPSFELTREQAVLKHLQALQCNNQPSPDHGIEVLYRFANFDPFSRSVYFGVNRDLGQFERFRRIFQTPSYSILLGHLQHTPLSCLKVSEFRWKQRVWVKGYKTGEEGVFEFNMVQRFGGHYDGLEKSASQGTCRLISDSSHQLRSALVEGDTWQTACDSSPPWRDLSRFCY